MNRIGILSTPWITWMAGVKDHDSTRVEDEHCFKVGTNKKQQSFVKEYNVHLNTHPAALDSTVLDFASSSSLA
jgi:hypothetical protein